MSLRILHLTGELPYVPGASGGSTRQFHLLRALAARGHDITVVAPVFDFQRKQVDLDGLYEDAGMHLRAVDRPRSRMSQLAAAIRSQPRVALRIPVDPYYGLQSHMLWALMEPSVRECLTHAPPDVITVEHDTSASWGAALAGASPAKVLTLHNYSPDYYESRAHSARGFRSVVNRAEARRMERYVRRHVRAFDHLVTVSDRDAELVRVLYAGPISVVPNGTTLPAEPEESPDGDVVLYTGSMSHPPNHEGAMWLLHRVWPLVTADRPQAKLQIVGRGPRESLRAEARRAHNVEVVGDVETLAPYYSDASVVVAPILSGGGTRLKVLDGLAAKRAVVATPLAVEGLDIADGDGLLVRGEPASFAAAVVSLLEHPDERARLASGGRAAVARRYEWQHLASELEDVLVGAADRTHPRTAVHG